MKQKQYSPLNVGQMAVSLFAADRGYLDDVDLQKIGSFEAAAIAFMASSRAELLATLNKGSWDGEIEAQLVAALDDFKATGTW
jgi:F-type H+-transporting ATPase subunit alpha